MTAKPIGICTQLCKRIIDDERSGLRSLIDLFTRFYVNQLPSEPQSFFVNAALTSGVGDHEVELRIVRALDGMRIYRQNHIVRFSDITDILQLFFEVRSVRFPSPGYYFKEVLVDDILISGGRRRIEVQRLERANDE